LSATSGMSTERPVPAALLRLALPVLASQLLRLAFQWVDALWVRGLGVSATAAVTSSVFVMWTVYALNDVFAVGVTAYVSQLIGAGDRARAGVAAWRGLRASALMGLGVAVAGHFGARHVFRLIGGGPGIEEQGGRYLSVILAGAPLPMVALTCESIMRAAGDTRTPLLLDLGAVSLNAVLAPLLIYGVGPVPALGVAGAAWATLSAQALLVTCYLVLAARRHRALPLARRSTRPPVSVASLTRVGIPAALVGFQFTVVYLVFAHAASWSGAAGVAVIGIGSRIEALLFVTCLAIGIAGATLVGQALGAGRRERAVRVMRTCILWGTLAGAAMTALCLLAPQWLVGLFTRDAAALDLGVRYLRILALCFIPTGYEFVAYETVMGSGHTRVVSTIFTVVSLARIPLALLVAGAWGFGVIGIVWMIAVTCLLRTIVIGAWIARGTWTRGLHDAAPPPVPAGVPPA
jgi:putative MATE family efflux protein